MEYIYGALLLHAAGKEIDEEKLKKVLTEAGVTTDEARLKSLVNGLKEVNIEEVLKNAATAQVMTAAAPASTQSAEAKPKEEKKEEKEEAKEEEAMEGLSSLFG